MASIRTMRRHAKIEAEERNQERDLQERVFQALTALMAARPIRWDNLPACRAAIVALAPGLKPGFMYSMDLSNFLAPSERDALRAALCDLIRACELKNPDAAKQDVICRFTLKMDGFGPLAKVWHDWFFVESLIETMKDTILWRNCMFHLVDTDRRAMAVAWMNYRNGGGPDRLDQWLAMRAKGLELADVIVSKGHLNV